MKNVFLIALSSLSLNQMLAMETVMEAAAPQSPKARISQPLGGDNSNNDSATSSKVTLYFDLREIPDRARVEGESSVPTLLSLQNNNNSNNSPVRETRSSTSRNEINEALLIAAAEGNLGLFKLALGQNADVNATNAKGATALMLVAKSFKDDAYTMMRLLIEKGARLDSQDAKGRTALVRAVDVKNSNGAKILLENGAQVNYESRYRCPLSLSIIRSDYQMTLLLRQHGARISASTDLEKDLRENINNISVVLGCIEEHVNVNCTYEKWSSRQATTPLLCAIQVPDNQKICEILINNGADVNAVGDSGDGGFWSEEVTPLKLSIKKRDSKTCHRLLLAGALIATDSCKDEQLLKDLLTLSVENEDVELCNYLVTQWIPANDSMKLHGLSKDDGKSTGERWRWYYGRLLQIAACKGNSQLCDVFVNAAVLYEADLEDAARTASSKGNLELSTMLWSKLSWWMRNRGYLVTSLGFGLTAGMLLMAKNTAH